MHLEQLAVQPIDAREVGPIDWALGLNDTPQELVNPVFALPAELAELVIGRGAILGVALSRIYLRVHYTSDAIAGSVLGAFVGISAASRTWTQGMSAAKLASSRMR